MLRTARSCDRRPRWLGWRHARSEPAAWLRECPAAARLRCRAGRAGSRCLQRPGLEQGDLEDASPEIATYQEVRIVENLVEALPDAGLGLQVGATYPIRVYGVYGFTMLTAPTLREIVEMAVRYQDLSFTLVRARIRREPPFTHMDLDASHLSQPIRSFVIDHAVSTVIASWHDLDRTALIPQIQLPISRQSLADAYRHTLGLTPRLGRHQCRVTFTDADLDRPRAGIDRRTFAQCEQQCLALLRERQSRSGVTGLIRARTGTAVRPTGIDGAGRLRIASLQPEPATRTLERRDLISGARTQQPAGPRPGDARSGMLSYRGRASPGLSRRRRVRQRLQALARYPARTSQTSPLVRRTATQKVINNANSPASALHPRHFAQRDECACNRRRRGSYRIAQMPV